MDVSETLPIILGSLAEARSYSCLLGNLPRDLGGGVHEIFRQIHPHDLLKPTFETDEQPHVTVLYGLHTHNPDEVFHQIRSGDAMRPVTMQIGNLDLFRHRDQDVLKLNIHSPEITHLHKIVRRLPNSFTFPKYEPHVTVAYLKPGRGEKYLGLKNPLAGREVTFNGLVFSTPQKRLSYVPLRAPRVEDIMELVVNWGFPEDQLIEMTTAMAIGTQARPFGFVRPIFPSVEPSASRKRSSVRSKAHEGQGELKRKLSESFDPVNIVNYSDLPYHLQLMDHVEGDGWEHHSDEHQYRVYLHQHYPDFQVRIRRRDSSPIWHVFGPAGSKHGDHLVDLRQALPGHEHYRDVDFE